MSKQQNAKETSNKVYRSFLFNKDRDSDLLDWLDGHSNRSKTVRRALRLLMESEGFCEPEVTLEDILREIQEVADKVSNIKVVSGKREPEATEPKDVVMKLKGFGL